MKKFLILSALASVLTFNSSFKTGDDNLNVTPIKNSRYENLFQVDLKLDKKDTITISLIGAEGIELYHERYIGTNYSKKFSLAVDGADLMYPIRVVVSKNTGKIKEYTFVPSQILYK